MLKKIIPILIIVAISSVVLLSSNRNNGIRNASFYPVLKNKVSEKYLDTVAKADEILLIDLRNSKSAPVEQIDLKNLKTIFLSDTSYLFSPGKLSMFVPSTKLIFKKGNEKRALLISHHAKKVQFLDPEERVLAMIDIQDPVFKELEDISNKYFDKGGNP